MSEGTGDGSPARRAISAAFLWVLLLAAGLCGCGDEDKGGGGSAGSSSRKKGSPRILGRAPTWRLMDQDGRTVNSYELLGRVWVANFFFTRCKATCPLQTARLRALQDKRKDRPTWSDLQFVGFSVDSGHDTPEVLTEYARTNGADTKTWTFLTGERRAIWKISTQGFKLFTGDDPTNADMPIAHSAFFVLVDRRGLIRGYFDSQKDEGVAELEAALPAVLAEPAPTNVPDPPEFGGPWLEAFEAAQRKASKDYRVFHDFGFEDRRAESEIRFVNRCVNDAGRDYKAVHYDHGNGVAVADVDGDGLLDIYFTNQVGSCQLWRNLGEGKFEDITDEAGVAVREPVGVTASFADTDNDGDPDLFVTTVHGGNFLFVNEGGGKFRDATKVSGLAYEGHSSSGVFFDFDRDGLLDLFVCNVGVYTKDEMVAIENDWTTTGQERGEFQYREGVLDAFSGHLKPERKESSLLYRNLGKNRFEDVTIDVGLFDDSWTGDATPIDVNRDGWIDLYVLDMQGHDEYFENQKGLAFTKRSREVFPKTPWGAMGVKSFDFDNDGDFDLYITDMHSDMSQRMAWDEEKVKSEMLWAESILRSEGKSIFGNAFFRNDGPGKFTEISDEIGAETYWPWGISVGDLNADGYDDVFVTASMNYLYRYGINSVLLNEGGKRFRDAEFLLGVEPRRDALAKPWFTLDCSGEDANRPECKGLKGEVTMWAPLGSRASVIFDLDGDGDLDVVTNEFNSEPLVLISDLTERRTVNHLSVRLVGTKSNRDGLGAVVIVKAGGRSYTKCNDGQSGYLSQSVQPLYFGLDEAKSVEAVEVRWPSGRTQTVKGPLEANRALVIREE